jgi:4-hydroxyacetophenone monooxygenase
MPDSEPQPSGEDAELQRALEAADPATLLLALVQLTGERHWLEAAKPFIRGPMNYQEFMPEPLRASVRDRLREVLAETARTGTTPHRPADDALLREMMAVAAGEAVSDDYIAMMREDLTDDTLQSRSLKWRLPPDPSARHKTEVIIVGAGMSGLYAGIQLQQAGIPFIILEKNDAVGGTWYENTYPGCGVDTPNHFYSYAFEPNHDWSHFFAKRDELWNYFERVADKYDLRKHIRLGIEVLDARYDEATATWRVTAQSADSPAHAFGPRAGLRRRRAQPAEITRYIRAKIIRRARIPYRAMGSQFRLARQARGHDRHWRLRPSGRPDHRA